MLPVNDSTLKQMTDTIVATANPVSVYLFGSYARGNARKDSDVDLLVVVENEFGPQFDRFSEINRIRAELRKYRIAKDVLLYNTEELNKWRHSRNHVIGVCVREGKLLYARP